ncbi:MAG: hypothetical protein COB09_07440 [Thalassobium sp.]|nr:MAG: hypothetical protein COB09_07440 [Thalassobium sp.]
MSWLTGSPSVKISGQIRGAYYACMSDNAQTCAHFPAAAIMQRFLNSPLTFGYTSALIFT